MKPTLIAYSTTDGQTLRICQRLQAILQQQQLPVQVMPMDAAQKTDLSTWGVLVIGASIRYGRHQKEVYRFIARHGELLQSHPNLFFSVNVVARKPQSPVGAGLVAIGPLQTTDSQRLTMHFDLTDLRLFVAIAEERNLTRGAARAYLAPGLNAVFSEHAFAVYPIVTQAVGAQAKVIPAKDWGHDLPAMLAAIDANTRVVFIANPNNPTGTWFDTEALDEFLQDVPEHVLVVLDEAYIEYAEGSDLPDGLDFLAAYPNLLVSRTFSKAYGLAALDRKSVV